MKKGVLSIVLCLAMIITSCSTVWTISSAKSKPVRLNVSKKSLKLGKKYQLKVKKAKGVTIKKKTFTKKGAAVSVSKKGKVTAKKAGKATVICKVKYKVKGKKKIYKKTLKCKITVLAGQKTESPAPGEASAPAVSQETQKPSAGQSGAPAGIASSEPNASAGPDVSQAPGNSAVPGGSAAPGGSSAPGSSAAPGSSSMPGNSTAPGDTSSPDATKEPDATVAPTGTPDGQETAKPEKTPLPTQPSVEVSDAFELIKDMGVGINLGNTMEACDDWINGSSASNYETAWQPDKTTPEAIQGMRKAGFKTLRIPVAWSNMMRDDGTYTINEAYFNRVDEIIGYALDAGMYAIVNIHWDGGWWARFGSKDGTERQEAMKKYKTMWTQLAEHYKDYSNMLIFESANEELGSDLNSTDYYKNSGYYTSEDDLYRLTNEINQTFVDIVRASGGKNTDRYLLIAGYHTDIDKTCDGRFEMPTDTIADHLMLSVHYYDPSTYCIVDDPNNSWGYQDSWGTDADIREMQTSLSKMKMRYTNQGIPVIIGEYGVVSNEPKAGRRLYFQTLCEYALENGMCPLLWENSGQVYKRSTASMIYEDEAKLYLELAAKAESMDVFVPVAGDGSYSWSGTLATEGDGYNFSATAGSLDNTLLLSSVGGCYKLTGVDWSKYSAPKLEIKASNFDKTMTIGLATQVDDSNQYWHQISKAEKTETIQPSSGAVIDLSSLDLSGTKSLYLLIVQGSTGSSFWPRQDFSGEFTLRITD